MIALIDYDSLIYKSVYKVVSIQEIKQFFYQNKSREWIEREIIERSINRLCNIGDGMMTEIEETGIVISHCEYYITPRHSYRRKLFREYKENRYKRINTMLKWVNKVRQYLLDSHFAIVKEGFEADDLIADRVRELGTDYIIVSIDKDLKQLPGVHFDYYRPTSKEYDAWGQKVKLPYRGIVIVSEEEARYSFWKQMLTGDGGDNVQGIKGIGPKTAEKILQSDYEAEVKQVYQEKHKDNWLAEYEKNHFFLYLGTDRNYETISLTYQ